MNKFEKTIYWLKEAVWNAKQTEMHIRQMTLGTKEWTVEDIDDDIDATIHKLNTAKSHLAGHNGS